MVADSPFLIGRQNERSHATAAAIAGASERSIMNQTGHRSVRMVRRYIREGSLFRENSAGKLGTIGFRLVLASISRNVRLCKPFFTFNGPFILQLGTTRALEPNHPASSSRSAWSQSSSSPPGCPSRAR
jgi:hypothetical protein